jgi:hypothetical protein
MSVLWRSYLRLLDRHPLRVQMVQTGFIMGVGDVVAQKALEEREEWDVARTARFAGLGVVFVVRVLFNV